MPTSFFSPQGGMVSSITLNHLDDVLNSTVIAQANTSDLKTYSGLGMIFIVVSGDGDPDVNMIYVKDGGSEVIICPSNVNSIVAISFSVSLILRVRNTNPSQTKAYSSLSLTGFLNKV